MYSSLKSGKYQIVFKALYYIPSASQYPIYLIEMLLLFSR